MLAAKLRAAMDRYTGVYLCCFGTPDADGLATAATAAGATVVMPPFTVFHSTFVP